MAFELRGICKDFRAGNGTVCALRDVSFAVREREFLSVVGPSGCGKTTLLRIIAGLLRPTTGVVRFAEPPPDGGLRAALVFQDHGLLPWCTVLENVALGLEFLGVARGTREALARAFIEQVGLAAFERHYPHQLSVGMRQRVAIARAFVADPEILLLDEPFGSLDAQTKLVLQEELLRIWRDHLTLVVHVTHDIEEAIILSDRILVMTGRPGRIREEVAVPLPRPRDLRALDRPGIADLRWHIWKCLEEEVREGLCVRG
ncbi:MAG: ABC transporter ATP-binding protein [Thermoanaerobaculales bacterium]